MNKCRFKSKFKYIKYTEENQLEVTQNIRAAGYSIASIDNIKDMIMYCKFDKETMMFTSDIKVLVPNTYIVFYDTGDIGAFTEDQFKETFEDVEEE